ncbi:hypothetical protein BU17DRAFT_43493 [Hysterangium stoloniferum]|nr:hypothetical protein BU17DRAFT_43493 [Hysterangium stoloniferum]
MDLGIVYHIEDARQFSAELEEIVQISPQSTLTRLDAALQNFVSFCAIYHQQYLQTPAQLERACCFLLDSDIFNCHSERLSTLVITDALSNTDPHAQLILFHVLLLHGRRHHSFFRSQKKWSELTPHLMDHIYLVDIEHHAWNSGSSNAWRSGMGVPIELRLSQLSVRILYEVCRVQKFNRERLEVFTDTFIDHLFDLVEGTRDMPDETMNYCLIKLIIALNEQFMVSSLNTSEDVSKEKHATDNRVIRILLRRLGSSKTFGENLIFMLNRADGSPEDRCMQLLVLKILYLLFTTSGTQEYFYTNDLCVLVDVFIRELVDLDEENESLRHTYLRVLHPLLTQTQLRSTPYKRPQILRMLESLISHAQIRDVSPTMKRLVERCLGGAWALELRRDKEGAASSSASSNPELDTQSASTLLHASSPARLHTLKDMKFSKSVDVLPLKAKDSSTKVNGHHDSSQRKAKSKVTEQNRRVSNESSLSLVSIAGAGASQRSSAFLISSTDPPPVGLLHPDSDGSHRLDSFNTLALVRSLESIATPPTPIFEDPASLVIYQEPEQDTKSSSPPRYRPAPAPPARRRKPPAIPPRSTKARNATPSTPIPSPLGFQ